MSATSTAAGGALVLIPFLGNIGVAPLLVDYKMWIGWLQIAITIVMFVMAVLTLLTLTITFNNNDSSSSGSSSPVTITTTSQTLPFAVTTGVLVFFSMVFWIVAMALTWLRIKQKQLYK